MLPPDLKDRAARLARRKQISFGELVRRSLEASLRGDEGEVREHSLFGEVEVWEDDGPTDWAARHDDILYGEVSGDREGAESSDAGSSRR